MKKPFIVAEIGINHNGSLDTVKKLVDMAVRCGVDAVKFQKRSIGVVYTPEFLRQNRESPWGKTQFDQKQGLELSKSDYDKIDNYCDNRGIPWFASAWDMASLRFLESYNCRYNKIASAMIMNTGFVSAVAQQKKITFISTGLCPSWYHIDKAVDIFTEAGCGFVLMHCVGVYPCPTKDLNMMMIPVLKRRYGCRVGYSGHSVGVGDGPLAVALGAEVVEKHVTLDHFMYGSDQQASLEEKGLRELIDRIGFVVEALGDGSRRWMAGEKDVAKKLRYWESK